ncbi:MAG: PhzF family phenazine biosynthesis protein [Reichenbachiella sp.]|uniref:PhzF family phenazine biosynthesis protein n=1 Tax=Reichenbachiella sp. TaxID=2184521 RepID=UPI003264C5C5
MEVLVRKIFAFSANGQGGNPAGVVLDADQLSHEQKQEVAAKVGLSETAFVSASNQADFKLDFFTPNRQISHCGHATVATFSFLKTQGLIQGNKSSKETIDGTRQIFFKDGNTYMEQKAPVFKSVNQDKVRILDSLGITNSALSEKLPLSIVNTGNSFLIIPIIDKEILAEITPNQPLIDSYSEKHDLIGYYLYAPTQDAEATTRMFAPRYGIAEEAATGMAAGPLAGYLYQQLITTKTQIFLRQGEYMRPPSPSEITVNLELKNGSMARLFAGGRAYVGEELVLNI